MPDQDALMLRFTGLPVSDDAMGLISEAIAEFRDVTIYYAVGGDAHSQLAYKMRPLRDGKVDVLGWDDEFVGCYDGVHRAMNAGSEKFKKKAS